MDKKVPSDEEVDALAHEIIATTGAWENWQSLARRILLRYGQPAQPAASVEPGCGCEACEPNTVGNIRMIVCAICGNKRCPHATDHRHACTGSNEPGQKGSSYEHCTAPVAAEASDCVTLDSALAAIDHVEQHNGPGRAAQARQMLVAAQPGLYDGDTLTAAYMAGQDSVRATPPASETPVTEQEEEAWQRMERRS